MLYLEVFAGGLLGGSFSLLLVGLFLKILKPKLPDDAGLGDVLVRLLDTPVWVILPLPLVFWSIKKADKNPEIILVNGVHAFKSDGFSATDIISKKAIDSLTNAWAFIAFLGAGFFAASVL